VAVELHPIPGNEVPKGLVAGELTTPDGTRLRYAVTRQGGERRGTVCVLEGRSEFIEKNFETVEELQRRGFAVAILDWRGQGGSDRALRNRFRGHVRSFRQYDEDLATFMTGAVLPDCPPPYFALAHSTGGLVLLRALTHRNWFERAVLSAPLIDFAPMIPPKPVARLIARLAVALGLGWLFVPGQPRRPISESDFPGNPLTSDAARFARATRTTDAFPHIGTGGPTFAWINAAFEATAALRRLPTGTLFLTPLLIVAAGDDTVVSTEAARAFARRRPGVAAVVIEHSRHEPLHERDEIREQFWAAFDAFIGTGQEEAQGGQVARSASASS
jgi:lysophospholipase